MSRLRENAVWAFLSGKSTLNRIATFPLAGNLPAIQSSGNLPTYHMREYWAAMHFYNDDNRFNM